MRNQPILIVEDDNDDCEMLMEAFKEIGVSKEFKCFDNPLLALEYLKSTDEDPFIIISDLNMPMMDGLSFKEAINEDDLLRKRKIPFILMSTERQEPLLETAFKLSVNGYFKKATDLESLKKLAISINTYWKEGGYHLHSEAV